MRIGTYLPKRDNNAVPLNAEQIAARARLVEQAGLDSIWCGEHIPLAGDTARDAPDTLLPLAIAAGATSSKVEIGTSIMCLPLHNPYSIAQRFATLRMMYPGDRWLFGVGTGSQRVEYEAIGLDWDGRFRRLHDHMRIVRSVFDPPPQERHEDMFAASHWNAGSDGSSEVIRYRNTIPQIVGTPRFALGAWVSDIQLKRAATDFDAWMVSGGPGTAKHGWKRVLEDGITKYRDLGGGRALVATVLIDLKVDARPMPDDGGFVLTCDPATARDRVRLLEDLGFDDIILKPLDFRAHGNTQEVFDFTERDLNAYRSLSL